jgi:hypothetical protein
VPIFEKTSGDGAFALGLKQALLVEDYDSAITAPFIDWHWCLIDLTVATRDNKGEAGDGV